MSIRDDNESTQVSTIPQRLQIAAKTTRKCFSVAIAQLLLAAPAVADCRVCRIVEALPSRTLCQCYVPAGDQVENRLVRLLEHSYLALQTTVYSIQRPRATVTEETIVSHEFRLVVSVSELVFL